MMPAPAWLACTRAPLPGLPSPSHVLLRPQLLTRPQPLPARRDSAPFRSPSPGLAAPCAPWRVGEVCRAGPDSGGTPMVGWTPRRSTHEENTDE
jgi:hypothetical protein